MNVFPLRHCVWIVTALFPLSFVASAADPAGASKIDTGFVGKVSQGGAFEVQASQLAVTKAVSADVKAFAEQDVADHQKVNDELKSIAAAQSIPLAPSLKPMFQKKLDKLGTLSGAAFDKAYIADMAKVHHKDEGIFAKEAQGGTSDDWKVFAAKTDQIVKGHISALDQIQTGMK
jgi:putative membrane protein